MQNKSQAFSGVGIGLRSCHYQYIETEQPDIAWFEVLSDNYLSDGGPHLAHLDKIRSSYPITFHGVGMSLGATDPINFDYIKKLKLLIKRTEPLMISDHLCWTSHKGRYFHELLPLPFTDEAIKHVSQRIRIIQDFLERPIMIENVSNYLEFIHSTLPEWEFLSTIADEADCLILLDVNNIYVSAHNNQFNPLTYINQLKTTRVAQFHLAGFEDQGNHFLDAHSQAISTPVWDLYKQAIKKFGCLPTCIEWDNQIPSFTQLQKEAEHAKFLLENDHAKIS